MDDKNTLLSGGFEDVVHAWCQFQHSFDSIGAVMRIPHVTNNDRSIFWLPRLLAIFSLVLSIVARHAVTQFELQFLSAD